MRLKKWQVITLIALAVLCFIVLGIGFAIVVMPNTGVTPVPVAVIQTQTAPPPTLTATPSPSPSHTPKPTDTPTPSDTPTPANSPTITLTPSKTPTPTKTGPSTRTPRPTNTPYPTPSANDYAWSNDVYSKCNSSSESVRRILSVSLKGLLDDKLLCLDHAHRGIAAFDAEIACMSEVAMPDANDLRNAHRLYLDHLESARSAYVIMESECATGEFDDRITQMLRQSVDQLSKYNDLVQRFKDANGLH